CWTSRNPTTATEGDTMSAGGKDHPDVIAFPPLIFLACLLIGAGLTAVLPGFLPPAYSPTLLIPGLVVVAGAGALALSGILAFRQAGTNVEPHKPSLVLVHDGPYRFTRNPMYAGLILMLLGLSLIFSVDCGLFMVPVLALVLHFGVVLREEAYLTAKFGAPYSAYLAETRRWI
ncbi:MAG: isoprenylcysteine carboxylmethyltransferase family protein, partial [Pseudomonadota bacterium]